MTPKRKFFLFKQSKHFCAVPWNHIEVWSDGSVRTCIRGQTLGDLNQSSLADITASNTLMAIKQDLLADKFNENCTSCHQLSTGNEHFDLRNHYNPMFVGSDVDYENLSDFKLNGVDLHWDNTCNFKCVYCNASQSSLIAQEQGITVDKIKKASVDQIIEKIVENQHSCREIYLSGGEPLLIKHNAVLLSRLSNTDIPIRINSNLSRAAAGNPVFEELKRFSNVLWTVSAEALDQRFNYIRQGGDWSVFLQNLSNVVNLGHRLRVNAVWFVGSALSLCDTIEFFVKEFKVTDFTVNQLSDHPNINIRHAPESVKIQAANQLETLLASGMIQPNSNSWYNISRCQRFLDQPGEPGSYANYFDHLDQLRNTDWKKTFPELVI